MRVAEDDALYHFFSHATEASSAAAVVAHDSRFEHVAEVAKQGEAKAEKVMAGAEAGVAAEEELVVQEKAAAS